MDRNDLPKDFVNAIRNITNKRAKFVIDTILKKGFCSTEDLKNAGYEHAPRAARDVRELGIPLETIRIKDSNGKSIAAYQFGNWEEVKQKNQLARAGGRTQLTSKLKSALLERYGARCNLYGEKYPERLLQPDHRIPYEIGGDPDDMMNTDYFMLLCPSANRDKSWACEHCSNWIRKDINQCATCYYAFPENYSHIAGEQERKIDLVFRGEKIQIYNDLTRMAKERNIKTEDFITRILEYAKKLGLDFDN